MKLKHNEIKREDLQNYIIDFPIILYIVTEYSLSKKLRSLRFERRDCVYNNYIYR